MLYRVIGVMSGSSLDGLDLAFVEIEELGGKWQYSLLQADCYAYPAEWQSKLSQAPKMTAVDFVKLDAEYGRFIGDQVNRFIESNQLDYKVGLIASHGHTVFHVPGSHSIQIGDGAAIAAKTAPITKVAEMTKSGFTPISAATRGFSAVARMARPSLVAFTIHINTASEMAVTAKIMIWVEEITAPPTLNGVVGNKVGYGL